MSPKIDASAGYCCLGLIDPSNLRKSLSGRNISLETETTDPAGSNDNSFQTDSPSWTFKYLLSIPVFGGREFSSKYCSEISGCPPGVMPS